MLPQKLDKTLLVGTSVVFFLVVNYVKLVPYYFLGQLNSATSPRRCCSRRWRRSASGSASGCTGACPSACSTR